MMEKTGIDVIENHHVITKLFTLFLYAMEWCSIVSCNQGSQLYCNFSNLQCISSTKLVSLGSTRSVLSAWQVNIEFKSLRWMAGHSNRFSITSPELCSYWSSTGNPLMSQRTSGWGRPNELKEKWSWRKISEMEHDI